MSTMRQSLLLVAGWIVAAVGAGVVASGAVAVAGGQVFDRPILPLNAAEVAALPVDESVATPGSSERLASGSSQARTGVTTEGCGRNTAGAFGSERPAGPGGAPAEPGGIEIDLTESPLPPIIHGIGGSLVFACVDGALQMVWATPQPSFAVAFSTDHQTVTFTSKSHRSTITIDIEGELFTIGTEEQEIS